MKRIFLTAAALLVSTTPPLVAHAQRAATDVAYQVDATIRREMRSRKIPGLQVAILRHGKIVLSRAYGVENIRTGKPMTTHSLMPINSISKAITGVAVMELVEAGKLRLDAPVSAYLDDLPPDWARITLQQLLSHTSGLPEIVDDNVNLVGGKDEETAWRTVQAMPVHFVPGSRFEYSQTNYALLQKVIEQITGETYARFILQRQTSIAQMTSTSVQEGSRLPPALVPTYTYLQLVIRDGQTVGVKQMAHLTRREELMPRCIAAAGGIVSTAQDLARWSSALQSRQILKQQSSLQALWKPQILDDGTYGGLDEKANGYAAGWPIIMRKKHPAYAPEGGERAAMFMYPHDDLTVIVLTNLMGGSPQQFIDEIASLYLEKPH